MYLLRIELVFYLKGINMSLIPVYSVSGVTGVMPLPIQSINNPDGNFTNAEKGQVWVNNTTGATFVYGGTVDGEGVWNEVSGGEFDFASISVSTGPNVLNGTLDINTDENHDVFINAGTSTGDVSIVSGTGSGSVSIGNDNAGIIDIVSGSDITIDTSATVSINSQDGDGDVSIVGGTATGSVTIGNEAAGDVDILAGGLMLLGSAGNMGIGSSGGDLTVSSNGTTSIEGTAGLIVSSSADLNIAATSNINVTGPTITVGKNDFTSNIAFNAFHVTGNAAVSGDATFTANASLIAASILSVNLAASGTGTITVNNNKVGVNSIVNVCFAYPSTALAEMRINKIKTNAGSLVVTYTNTGSQTLATQVGMFIQVLS